MYGIVRKLLRPGKSLPAFAYWKEYAMVAVVKPNKLGKADATNKAAWEIIRAEARDRARKTARLREARLAMEARAPKPEQKPTRAKKAAA